MHLNRGLKLSHRGIKLHFRLIVLLAFLSCTTSDLQVDLTTRSEEEVSDLLEDEHQEEANEDTTAPLSRRLLSLGDSYTIGTSVCSRCNYPTQLADSLTDYQTEVTIIAQSGWTTSRLITEIDTRDPDNSYDLVTLLIGVNNQFQGLPFETYEMEFVTLLQTAIQLAQDHEERVVVLSIPDYAYSNFGQNWGNPATTSAEIDTYNAYAETVCHDANVTFIDITDISREALSRPELLASDGLHLSEIAYSEFVKRLLPEVHSKLETN